MVPQKILQAAIWLLLQHIWRNIRHRQPEFYQKNMIWRAVYWIRCNWQWKRLWTDLPSAHCTAMVLFISSCLFHPYIAVVVLWPGLKPEPCWVCWMSLFSLRKAHTCELTSDCRILDKTTDSCVGHKCHHLCGIELHELFFRIEGILPEAKPDL